MQYAIYSLIAIVIIGGGWFLLSPQSADAPEDSDTVTEVETGNEGMMVEDEGTVDEEDAMVVEDDTMAEDEAMNDEDKADIVIDLTGKNFEFSKKEIKVKEGDTVQINFTSENGFHDWKLSDYEVATERVNTGGSSSVTFVAEKTGSFEYYCSVGSHRTLGMVGTLIVE
jgi:plastocyanin